jgi:hypothetical protein
MHLVRRRIIDIRNNIHKAPNKTARSTKIVKYTAPDYNEAVFYIYYIGRYNDELIYKYGVSTDIIKTESRFLNYGIDKFMKIKIEPIEHHVYAIDKFSLHLQNLKIYRTLNINDKYISNLFALTDNYNYYYISDILNDAFS